MCLLNLCTQSLRQNEKWELLNDVCTNVSLELLILFVSKDLLLILIVLSSQYSPSKTINSIQEILFCIKDAVSKTGNPLHDTFLNILVRNQ